MTTPDTAGALKPDWPISKDGPHKIGDHRRWLARKLMDSMLDEKTAFNIVAFSPAISAAASRPSVDAGVVERVRGVVHDCISYIEGEISGSSQRDGILSEARALLSALEGEGK